MPPGNRLAGKLEHFGQVAVPGLRPILLRLIVSDCFSRRTLVGEACGLIGFVQEARNSL